MRMDVTIRYCENGHPVLQKLLVLKGEALDGMAFHERAEEFYPAHKRGGIKEAG